MVGQRETIGIAAVAALAAVLCDLLHEAGHLAASLLPLGVSAISISTIGVSSEGSSAIVAAAGSLANLALGLGLVVALRPPGSPALRYFAWLLGTMNLLNVSAYPLYSAVLGSGDWAQIVGVGAGWRIALGVAGAFAYAASLYASAAVLRRLAESGVVPAARLERYCVLPFWTAGVVLTLGAVFNPVNPWFILTSGAATGFGAMLGLLVLPKLVLRGGPVESRGTGPLPIGWGWIAAGLLATVVFVGVFGPGLSIASLSRR